MLAEFAEALVSLITLQAQPTVYLVHVAMLSYAAGFLFRSQIILRCLILIGTGFYIAYYALHPATPLWDAVFASLVIGTANIIGLTRLLVDRLPFGMGRAGEVLDAFNAIAPGTMRPGGVRRIMRRAAIRDAAEATPLIRAGVRPEALFLLIEGHAHVSKDGERHRLDAPCFMGEIAFITENVASADVTVAQGARYVAWGPTSLHARMEASAEIDRGLRSLVSYDLARKLANSVPVLPEPREEPMHLPRAVWPGEPRADAAIHAATHAAARGLQAVPGRTN